MALPNTNHQELSWYVPALVAGLTLSLADSALAAPTPLSPQVAKSDAAIARILVQKPATGWSTVILKLSGDLTAAQELQIRSLGGDIYRRLSIIRSVAVRIPSRSLPKLAALPFVTHLSLDGLVKKSDEFTVASSEANQAVAMDTKGRSYTLTGKGITVAVLDSGITPLPDLSSSSSDYRGLKPSRLLTSVNFANTLAGNGKGGVTYSVVTSNGNISIVNNGNAYDPCGHGTHVAGIIAGNGVHSAGPLFTHTFLGIAPQVNLVSIRVLDQSGQSDVSTVISGLQWVMSNQKKYNIRVINLSLGHPVGDTYTNDPLCQAVEAAESAGIVVVCAAGNQGRANAANDPTLDNEGWGTAYGSIQSPANDPAVITVGATKSTDGLRADDRIATYSSRGPSRLDLVLKPDIIAPGNQIISLDAGGSALDVYAGGSNQIPYSAYVRSTAGLGTSGSSGDYFRLSGTSMAAPVVAGAAALLLQANPNLSPDTIKARLMLSADKWTDPSGNGNLFAYGAGYLNIPAALACTAIAQGPALSPSLGIDAQGNVFLAMDRAIWGSSLWGTGITDLRAVWGSNTVAASRAVWGSGVLADRAVWGSADTAVDLTSTALTGE